MSADPPIPDVFSAELGRIAAEAAALRAARDAAAPGAAAPRDLAAVARSGALVDRFLADVAEAIKQVCVAGLAFPDPELPDELAALADRARRLRLPAAVERLLRLRAFLRAIAAEGSLEARHHLSAEAWDETQRAIAWLRMYRIEHDLLTVQGRMAAAAEGTAGAGDAPDYQTRTLTAWPLGLELDGGGKLVIHALDLDTGGAVLLRDHLSDFDAHDPLNAPAISRLFQDAVRLGQLLAGLIRFEDHPVVERPDALVFRPAFRAIPRRLAVSPDFAAPALPAACVGPDGAPAPGGPKGPGSLRAAVVRARDGVQLRPDGADAPLALAPSPTLRLNLTKLLAARGAGRAALELAVLPRDEHFAVLHARSDLDERVFPAHDPTLFRLPARTLARRAEEAARAPGTEPVLGVALRAAAYLHGGLGREALAALRADLVAAAPVGLAGHYRAALAAWMLGDEAARPGAVEVARDALRLAALSDAAEVDLAQLARVLGRAAGEVSPGDLRAVDGQAVYRAVWLAIECDACSALRDELEAVWRARLAGELRDPSVGAVCARALLLALRDDGAADAAAGEAPAPPSAAAEYLAAHLATLAPRPGSKSRPGPLPDPLELVQLGDTLALVHGAERRAATAAALGLPAGRIAQRCADDLCDWLAAEGAAPPEALWAATDALLAAAAAALGRWLVV